MNCVNDNNVCSASVCLSERFAGGRSKRTRTIVSWAWPDLWEVGSQTASLERAKRP